MQPAAAAAAGLDAYRGVHRGPLLYSLVADHRRQLQSWLFCWRSQPSMPRHGGEQITNADKQIFAAAFALSLVFVF
eukprot:SAG31_NODE_7522_length_1666_cov_1.345246_3_plen_76_part_00